MIPGKSHLTFLDRSVRAGAILVFSVGVAVLVGWSADIHILKTLLPGLASMKANTAAAFLAAATSLWLLHASARPAAWRVARVLAIFVVAIGGLSLVEYGLQLDLGIDQLIVRDGFGEIASQAGRMAPITALNFVFAGLGLLTLNANHPRTAGWANWFVAVPLFFSMLAILGYAYGVSSLYRVGPFSSIALHTALAFFVLSLSLLAANPRRGIAGLFASESAGGVVTRRLLPTIPLALFFLGWARLLGQQAGLYDTQFGVALNVLVSIAVSIFSISATGFALRTVDHRRQRAEASLIELNIGLERTVVARTAELTKTSADLVAANAALERLSLLDALTGLANRRFFDGYLVTQIAVAHRQKLPLALILCDVDCFKEYNDNEGHQAGDAVLEEIAGVLKACCRRPADIAARHGGEEFMLVLPDTDRAGARAIAEAARAAIERLGIRHRHSAVAPVVTISAGISVLIDEITTSEQLIGAADKALYEAKRLGRNCVAGDAAPALAKSA